MARTDHVDRAARAEIVTFREDDSCVPTTPVLLHGRVERLHVDDHHLDVRGLGEFVQPVQIRRVVDEGVQFLPIALVAVAAGRVEIVACHVQRFGDALADGDGRDHDDELRPAIPAVQFEHGLRVHERLARAGLHLHVQFDGTGRIRVQLRGFRQVLPTLYVFDVGEQPFAVQQQICVAVARVVIRVEMAEHLLHRPQLGDIESVLSGIEHLGCGLTDTGVADIGDAILQRLAVEHVAYRVRSIGLVLVLREFELHIGDLR